MTIRITIAPGANVRLANAYSPLIEAVASLHVLVEPKHHPIHHPWVRMGRLLPATLRREIKAFAFSYRGSLPRFLFLESTRSAEVLPFEAELRSLSLVPPDAAAWELTRPLHPRGTPDFAALRRRPVRTAIERAAEGLGEGSANLVRLALNAPEQAAERFRSLLTDYWESGFAAEWERIGARLAEDVSEIRRRFDAIGLYEGLQGLCPEIHIDPSKAMFWLDDPHEHALQVGKGQGLLLIPSLYTWPHVQVSCDDPWPLGLIFPSPSVVTDVQSAIPPQEVLQMLRALADDTRMRSLQFISERPRSTQELAPLVRLSEAAMSKHLRILAAAGIIQARREGYYVLYGLAENRLATLHSLITAYLGPGRLPKTEDDPS